MHWGRDASDVASDQAGGSHGLTPAVAQAAHIPDPSGGILGDAEAPAAINAISAALEGMAS